MKRIIIGKNSNLVKSIDTDHDCISHSEVDGYDFSEYHEIFLFSWSFDSIDDNLLLLNKLPIKKVIFVSSISVFSTILRKQWNKYPNWKSIVENYVLSSGGKVVRLGITNQNHIYKLNDSVPYTSVSSINNYINQQSKQDVTNLFNIIDIHRKRTFLFYFEIFLNRCSLYLPSIFLFQAPIEFILKSVGSFYYGYTFHTLRFFNRHFQIGYGALGSRLKKKDSIVIYSNKPDIILNDNGFRMNRLGYYKNGLNKFWHAVRIVKSKGFFIKSVPKFVSRSKPSIASLALNVDNIKYDNDLYTIHINSKKIKGLSLYCRKLSLAAGSVENCKLLAGLSNFKKHIYFDDHELSLCGSVNLSELVQKNIVNKFLCFVWGRKVFVSSDKAFLLDFRPKNSNKYDANFYNDYTSNIFFKLVKSFSFDRLNEAFFNKFGFAFYKTKFDCFMQLYSPDCIVLNGNSLTRNRLPIVSYNHIFDEISSSFKTFEKSKCIYSFDGIHIIGGSGLLSDPMINSLIKSKKLVIYGSPTHFKMNCFHHTFDLIDHCKF